MAMDGMRIKRRPVITHVGHPDDQNAAINLHAVGEPGAGGAHTTYWAESGDLVYALSFVYQTADGQFSVGLTNEVLLAIVKDRLEAFQAGPYACRENAVALDGIDKALEALKSRTKARIAQGVEGKMEKHAENEPRPGTSLGSMPPLVALTVDRLVIGGTFEFNRNELKMWGTWPHVEAAIRKDGRPLEDADWAVLEKAASAAGNGGRSGFTELRQALTKNVSVKK